MNELTEQDNTENDQALSGQVDPIVMWGDYKVTKYCGPTEFADWDFGDETPWLACEKDGFQVVVPNWAIVDDDMDYLLAGISFIDMIENYKATFLGYDSEPGEKERAISELKKAISILEAT